MRRPRLGMGPNYLRLWTATTVSNLGDGITLAALPLLAASLTDDPLQVSGIAVAAGLPWLLVTLHAGAIVDRVDRRRLMALVNLARTALAGALALAVALDVASMPLLYAVGFLLGVGETVHDNAEQPLIAALVPPDRLPTANARLSTGEIVANGFAGRPMGGFLFAAAAGLPFLLDAGTFAVSAALLLSLRGSFRAGGAAPRGRLRGEIAEGLRWLWAHRLIRTLAGLLALLNLMYAIGLATLVLFALDVLHLSEAGYGLLLTAAAAGGLAGSIVAPWLSRRLGPAPVLLGAMVGEGAALAGTGLAANRWATGVLLALEGLIAVVWNVITLSLRQELVPDRLLGRVTSAYRLVGVGVWPVGGALGGLLADALGLRAPLVIAGGAVLLGAALSVRILTPAAIAAARAASHRAPSAPDTATRDTATRRSG